MRTCFAVFVVGAVIASGLIPATAAAQEPARGEVYGGFLWTTGLSDGVPSTNLFGAVGEGTGYVNEWFGITGEVGWSTRELVEFVEFRQSELTFAGGPRFRFANDSRVTPSLRALVGGRQERWSFMGESYSQTHFVIFVGGAVDIRASELISVRVQPDLVLWPDDGVIETSFRLSAGLVFAF